MKNPITTITREPVMAAILAVVGATVALLVAFHVHVTADQREAIEGWVGAVLLLGVAVRSAVTPNGKLAPEPVDAQTPVAAVAAAEPAPPVLVVPQTAMPVAGPDHPA